MKNQSISITREDPGTQDARLLLEGLLIMKNAHLVKKELVAAINTSRDIELVFRNIVKMDLSILQLLVSAQKSAALLGKNLSLDLELGDDSQSTIRNSGLEKVLAQNFKMELDGIY